MEIKGRDLKLVKDFYNYCLAQGLSEGRVEKYAYLIRNLRKMFGKSFQEVKKEDVIKVLSEIERLNLTYWTKRDYKVVLKKFYEFLGKEDLVSWIKTTGTKQQRKKEEKKLPSEILTVKEIKKMANAADNIRDKALVLTLYETGARIGEFLNMRVGDIKFDEHGARVVLEGKTGMRVIRIISSVPALAQWVAQHPFKNDKDAFLWVGLTRRAKNKPISYREVLKILKNLARKANIRKNIYPSLLRHSRATELAKILTEQQLKLFFGWEMSSKMASVYVHLSGKDLDAALLKAAGIEIEERKEQEFKPMKCARCGYVNDPASKFCVNCGMPLTLKAAVELEEKRQIADVIMNLLFKDEEFVKFVEKKLKKLKSSL